MIFPNHPAFEELRPGMGYQPGAHAFLGYHPGSTMGDFSSSEESAALTYGISQSDLDLLSSLGATDQDLQNLINGNVTLAQLYAQYGVTSMPGVAIPTPSTPSPSATAQPQGQLPTGSVVNYVGGWSPIHGAVSDVQAALSTKLTGYGMQLTAFNSTGSSLLGVGTAGFTATIAITGVGFALLTDAQSIIVTIVQSVIGTGNLTTNQINLVSTPSTPAGNPQPNPNDPLTWFENNAIYIAAAVGALVLLNNFTGKRR
jgi:hypothetical protein